MWEAGIDIKEMVQGYLKSLKSEEPEDVKSSSWEMNNCELTTSDEGRSLNSRFNKFKL